MSAETVKCNRWTKFFFVAVMLLFSQIPKQLVINVINKWYAYFQNFTTIS